jgi:replicative DNA helicase
MSAIPKKGNLLAFEGSKVMPSNIDGEIAVLGAILTDDKCLSKIGDLLKVETFYKPEHRAIYSAIVALYEKNSAIDMLTVVGELRTSGQLAEAGGVMYVSELTNRVASAANVEWHTRILQQIYVQREIIKTGSGLTTLGYDDTENPFAVLDEAQQRLFDVVTSTMAQPAKDMKHLGIEFIQQLDALNDTGLTGTSTGFDALDDLLGGLQASDLMIIAARPGMGKTALALCIANNVAKAGKKVGFFSLEMSSKQLMQRLVCLDARVNSEHLRTGKISNEERAALSSGVTRLSTRPIDVDDTCALNIYDLKTKCRKMKMQHGLDLIVVDYLQLMRGRGDKGSNREQEISQISAGLKTLAKDLNVPVIALAQLSREVEKRQGANKRPQLSDLRESGSIEQDADQVCFIHRPEYYNVSEDAFGNSTAGMAEIIVAKNRHGRTDSVKLRFDATTTHFDDWTTTVPTFTIPTQPVLSRDITIPF